MLLSIVHRNDGSGEQPWRKIWQEFLVCRGHGRSRLARRGDFESRELTRCWLDIHCGYLCGRRTPVRPGDDGLDAVRGPCDDRFDVTVSAIAHPAAQFQRARLVGQRVAEADALHATLDDQASDDGRQCAQRPAVCFAISSSPIIVLLSVISPRSSKASASSRLMPKVSMNSPWSSRAPTYVNSSATKMSICSVE